jgi:hypothetical protein
MICSERVIPPERQHSVPRRHAAEVRNCTNAVADSSLPNLRQIARYHSLLKTPLLATFLLPSVVCAPQWDDRIVHRGGFGFFRDQLPLSTKSGTLVVARHCRGAGDLHLDQRQEKIRPNCQAPRGPCDQTTPVTQRPGNSIYPSWGSEWPYKEILGDFSVLRDETEQAPCFPARARQIHPHISTRISTRDPGPDHAGGLSLYPAKTRSPVDPQRAPSSSSVGVKKCVLKDARRSARPEPCTSQEATFGSSRLLLAHPPALLIGWICRCWSAIKQVCCRLMIVHPARRKRRRPMMDFLENLGLLIVTLGLPLLGAFLVFLMLRWLLRAGSR